MPTSVDIVFNATQYKDAFDETSQLLFLAFISQTAPLICTFLDWEIKETHIFFAIF